jgi:short-subunit dehydrogenase
VITGGSDGIGFACAKHLAKKGFNICIIARTESKIKDKLAELKSEISNSDFKTDYFLADFGQLSSIDRYREIANEIKTRGYDVGVLVLNAGISGEVGKLESWSDTTVE